MLQLYKERKMKKDFLNDENLTFKDLLSFINKDFYKYITTKRQLTEFTRKLLDTYCDEKGILLHILDLPQKSRLTISC